MSNLILIEPLELNKLIVEAVRTVLMERENQDLVSTKFEDNRSYDFKGYYTVKEVANVLRVTVRTVYNWHRNEELIPVKIGGRYYHCKKEIDSLAKIN